MKVKMATKVDCYYFYDEDNTILDVVALSEIHSVADVAIESNYLMKYNWYSQQLKNEFESKLIRMLNNV